MSRRDDERARMLDRQRSFHGDGADATMREMRDMMGRISAEMSSLRAEVGRLVGEVDKMKQQPPSEPPAPPKPPEYAKGSWYRLLSSPPQYVFTPDDRNDPRPHPPGPDRRDEFEGGPYYRGLSAPSEDESQPQYRSLGAM